MKNILKFFRIFLVWLLLLSNFVTQNAWVSLNETDFGPENRMGAAGPVRLTKAFGSMLNLPAHPEGVMQHLQTQAVNVGVNTLLNTTIGGKDFKEALQEGLKSLAINTAGGFLAGEIGKAYQGRYGTIDPLTHKLLHGLLGGVTGTILSDQAAHGAIAGAIGGIVGEIVGEGQFDSLSEADLEKALANPAPIILKSRLAAALTTALAGYDPVIASTIADNAVRNNSSVARRLIMKLVPKLKNTLKTGKKLKTDNPKSAAQAEKLRRQLIQEQHLSEEGKILFRGGKDFRDAGKFAQQYGGKAEDWVKKTSSSFQKADGTKIETHWVENLKTGKRVNIKEVIYAGKK